MSGSEVHKILWLDDKIETAHQVLVDALREAGHEVSTCTTPSRARELLRSDHGFDVAIIDLRLPGFDETGIDLLEEWTKQEDAFQSLRVIAFSAHLDQKTYRDALKRIAWPIFVLDKGRINAPGVTSSPDEFVRLVEDALADLTWQNPGDYLDTYERELKNLKPDSILRSIFASLTEAQQSVVYDNGFAAAEKRLERMRKRDGTTWALFCGSFSKAVQSGGPGDVTPSNFEIESIAESQNRIPFFVSSDDAFFVEDLSIDCLGTMRTYPRVTVHLGDAPAARTAHFDTGSDAHFFKKADLVDAGVSMVGNWQGYVNPNTKRNYRYLNVEPFGGWLEPSPDRTGERINVEFRRSVAIDGWQNSRFARHCDSPDGCYIGDELFAGGDCRVRDALLGRNLLADNGLEAIVRGDANLEIRRPKE